MERPVTLRTENLRKVYASGCEALAGVNLTLTQGEVYVVIGPSGAGKSTLLRCVNRLVEPNSGKVWVGKVEMTALNKKQLREARRKMGMIFQSFALVDRLSVMENVLSGALGSIGFWRSWRRRFTEEQVAHALKMVERLGLAGLENQRTDRLSGGQRQRVGIARALIQRPELLLVDEPTASLDPKTSRQLMRLLTELAEEENLTLLINMHDVLLAKQFAQRMGGLRDGKLVFEGAPTELSQEMLTQIYGEEDWGFATQSSKE
ncbi:MAG: phosphonate ABC transporter ATP-binding protein [Verrucomicrobiales bacterium]